MLEIVRLDGTASEPLVADHAPVLHLRGQVVPVVPARWVFGATDPVDGPRCVVLVRDGVRTFGLVVDAVSHIEDVAVASVASGARGGFDGACTTTLGDGRDALLVDLAGVVARAARWIDADEPDGRERVTLPLGTSGDARARVLRSADDPTRAAS